MDRGWGCWLMLASLRDHQTQGIGDFLALKGLLPHLAACGIRFLQLLPIYDTGKIPSPYSVMTQCALHPIYVRIPTQYTLLQQWERKARLCYHKVAQAKWSALEKWYAAEKSVVQHDAVSLQYAQWAAQRIGVDPDVYAFALLQAHLQMEQVRQAAQTLGITLIGDLPLLPTHTSFDVQQWNCFEKGSDVGAPPAKDGRHAGQNWRFAPVKNFADRSVQPWHTARLDFLRRYFSGVRIDHIAGYFRLWKIANGAAAAEGTFDPATEEQALQCGCEVLAHFQKLFTCVIGEDFGIIPPSFRACMAQHRCARMCGSRWTPRHPTTFSHDTVTYLSTHDMAPWSQWQQQEPVQFAKYATSWGCTAHFHSWIDALRVSGSAIAMLSLDEWLLWSGYRESQRINIPGTVHFRNWSWRMSKPFATVAWRVLPSRL